MKKTLLTTVLLATSVLTLAACGSSDSQQQVKKIETGKSATTQKEKSDSSASSQNDSVSSNQTDDTSDQRVTENDVVLEEAQVDTQMIKRKATDAVNTAMTMLGTADGNPASKEFDQKDRDENAKGKFGDPDLLSNLLAILNQSTESGKMTIEDKGFAPQTTSTPKVGDVYKVDKLEWDEPLRREDGLVEISAELDYHVNGSEKFSYTRNLRFIMKDDGLIVGV